MPYKSGMDSTRLGYAALLGVLYWALLIDYRDMGNFWRNCGGLGCVK